MKNNCLDIGAMQAFMDCELDQTESASVSSHIAVCDACATLLARSEDEAAIVFPTLDREFGTLVPTQRLWNKINDSIETERESRPFWHKAWAFFVLTLTNPSLAAAAGLLIVAGIFALLWTGRTVAPTDIADNSVRLTNILPSSPSIAPVPPKGREPSTRAERAAYRLEPSAGKPEARFITRGNGKPSNLDTTVSSRFMPGEESYIKTISSLSRSVEGQKDTVMRPSQRIAYERDMAVVNDAIKNMRDEVKRNPKNDSAKQVLYASYQNKIDLLNSVSQKEELMATLR